MSVFVHPEEDGEASSGLSLCWYAELRGGRMEMEPELMTSFRHYRFSAIKVI